MSKLIPLYCHPEYDEYSEQWMMCKDTYEGDNKTLRNDKYLIRHELENGATQDGRKIRQIREARTVYENDIEPVVSVYSSIFFHKEPKLDQSVIDLFGDDINDVTGDGKSLTSFIKECVLKDLLVFGRPIIFTDAPRDIGASKQEQQTKKLSPRFSTLCPLAVKDWEFDEQGLKFIRYEFERIAPRNSALEKPTEELWSKVLSFDNNVYTIQHYKAKDEEASEPQWELIESLDFPDYPNLPVRGLFNEQSWIKDLAPIALKIYNLQSTRDNIQLFQAHQRIFFRGVSDNASRKALAEFTAGFLPADGGVETIEPVNTSSIDENIRSTKENLFKIAYNRDRTVAADSKQVEAAGTIQESKDGMYSLVKSELVNLENLVNSAIQDYAWFKTGKKDFQGKIHFDRDIKIEDIQSQINFALQFKDDIKAVPDWYKATLKKLLQAQELPNEDEIIKQIDEAQATKSVTADARTQLLQSLNG